jgi:AraC-like DNA-binding protein
MGQSGLPQASATKVQVADGVGTKGRFSKDWRVAKLLQSIDRRNGAIDRNLAHICRELNLGISPAYAARLFRRHIGQGVREYAKKKRLLKVVEQLVATDLPVKAIAAESGYLRTFDLTRSFEKQFCITPTRFRNANRLRLISQ